MATIPAVVELERFRIRCPECRGSLVEERAGAQCSGCGTGYPVRDGVVDLLPSEAGERTAAQSLMKRDWMARIYVVEAGAVERVIQEPKHPYSQLLVESIPHMRAVRPAMARRVAKPRDPGQPVVSLCGWG